MYHSGFNFKHLIRMKIVVIAVFTVLLSLTGCYKVSVQQGNILKQENIDEIKPGMTKQQVAIVLGTPTIADPFDQDRWDYINTTKFQGEFKKVKKFTLFFDDNKLVKTEGNYFPDSEDGTTQIE